MRGPVLRRLYAEIIIVKCEAVSQNENPWSCEKISGLDLNTDMVLPEGLDRELLNDACIDPVGVGQSRGAIVLDYIGIFPAPEIQVGKVPAGKRHGRVRLNRSQAVGHDQERVCDRQTFNEIGVVEEEIV